MIEDRDKRWQEKANAAIGWQRTTNETQTNAEQFHTNTPSTFSRQTNYSRSRDLSVNVTNEFQLKKPFFLYSWSYLQYNNTDNNTLNRSAQFIADLHIVVCAVDHSQPRGVLEKYARVKGVPEIHRIPGRKVSRGPH